MFVIFVDSLESHQKDFNILFKKQIPSNLSSIFFMLSPPLLFNISCTFIFSIILLALLWLKLPDRARLCIFWELVFAPSLRDGLSGAITPWHQQSAAAEFGWGFSLLVVTGPKMFPWRAKAWILDWDPDLLLFVQHCRLLNQKQIEL